MQTFKSDLLIFLLHFGDKVFNLSFCALDLKEIFVTSEVISFSCSKFLQKSCLLKRS